MADSSIIGPSMPDLLTVLRREMHAHERRPQLTVDETLARAFEAFKTHSTVKEVPFFLSFLLSRLLYSPSSLLLHIYSAHTESDQAPVIRP